MNKEGGITITERPFIPQTKTGSDGTPPRRGVRVAGGLYDDVPEAFKNAFPRKEDLDPTITPVKRSIYSIQRINERNTL